MGLHPAALAKELQDNGLQHQKEPFKLRAGGESHWYFDTKLAMASGDTEAKVGRLAIARAKTLEIDYSHICAMGIGGFAMMFGMVISALPERSVKWTMAYDGGPGDPDNGLHGGSVKDKTVLLVDDVLMTGDSLITTTKMINDKGGEVDNTLVVLSRSRGIVEKRLKEEQGLNV
jgi:orotate phosphoribosyltransferase